MLNVYEEINGCFVRWKLIVDLEKRCEHVIASLHSQCLGSMGVDDNPTEVIIVL